jgi:hypothetical protein
MVMQTVKRLKTGGGMSIDIDDSSAKNSVALSKAKAVSLYSTTDCYIKFGGDTVTVSDSSYDFFLPAFMMRDFENTNPYIAVIRDSADGTLYIGQYE